MPMVVVSRHYGQVARKPKPILPSGVEVQVADRAVVVGIFVAVVRLSAACRIVQPVVFVPTLFVIAVPHIGVKVQVVVGDTGLDGRVGVEGSVRLVTLVVLGGLGAVDGDAAHEVAGFGRGQAVQQVAGGVRFGGGVERAGKVSVAVVPFAPVKRWLQVQEHLVPSELERVRSVEPRLAVELFVCFLGVSVAVG